MERELISLCETASLARKKKSPNGPHARVLWAGPLLGLLVLAGASQPARALVIDPTFSSAITSSADSTTIESAITQAITFYDQTFTNPITVNIDFTTSNSANFIGQSQSVVGTTSYASYTAALLANATANQNAVELGGYDHLATGNQAPQIMATSADLRALGLSVPGGAFGGTITLSSYYLAGFGGSGSYAPNPAIQHEIDEVLGIGGAGSTLNYLVNSGGSAANAVGAPIINGEPTIGPLDLFRYAASGTPSYNSAGSATSYFSLDGGHTNIEPFNQNSSGDYGDWGTTVTPEVQDAFGSSANVALTLASPEVLALQAIGYDTVPEPASAVLFGSALTGLFYTRRRVFRRG